MFFLNIINYPRNDLFRILNGFTLLYLLKLLPEVLFL